MGGGGLASKTRFLVLALSALYALAALVGPFVVNLDAASDIAIAIAFLIGGAALMIAGQLLVPPGTRSAALISSGAVLGGLPLFWTFLVPIAAATVIACSIKLARQPSAPA